MNSIKPSVFAVAVLAALLAGCDRDATDPRPPSEAAPTQPGGTIVTPPVTGEKQTPVTPGAPGDASPRGAGGSGSSKP